MRENIAMAWVENLESGEFEQGKSALCENGKFCCLGVLSEMAHREGIITKETNKWGTAYYGAESAYLPVRVTEWAGMKNDYGCIPGSEQDALSVMNDAGVSFKEIAAIIRENWEKL